MIRAKKNLLNVLLIVLACAALLSLSPWELGARFNLAAARIFNTARLISC